MFQDLPTLSVQPYLVQNIRRRELVRFLNIRSLFTFLNMLPLLLFIPFSIRVIGAKYGFAGSSVFLISILSLTVFNHFFSLYIKRKTIINNWWLVGFLLAVVLVGCCDYWKLFSIRDASAALFTPFLHKPWLCLAPVVLGIAAFMNNNRFLEKNLYLEELKKSSGKKQSAEYAWLQRFGELGDLMGMDLKMILRNKRTRYVLFISILILLYGFIFYKPQYLQHNQYSSLLIGAIFVTGVFIINYGNFLFAWQSAQFDGLMTFNINIRMYIKSKFLLFNMVSTLSLFVASLYGFISWKIIPLQLAAYFYNIGINTVIAGYFATRSYRGINLGRAASFNYQGMGAAQWIYALVVMLPPFIIYGLFTLVAPSWVGVAVLGFLGLVSFLLQDWWIGIITKEFLKRKYLILEGFRQK
jgi:hypothetical protein